MTTVFIGGSRRISRLSDLIRSRADNIIEQNLRVVIGDANGADKSMQQYFAAKGYRNILVYYVGEHCRNNVGNWPTRQIMAPHSKKDFAYYGTKDLKMAREASCGFMIWDGKSKGTLHNIVALLQQDKKVLVYFAPDSTWHTLRSPDDLEGVLAKCTSVDRQRLGSARLPFEGSQLAFFRDSRD